MSSESARASSQIFKLILIHVLSDVKAFTFLGMSMYKLLALLAQRKDPLVLLIV